MCAHSAVKERSTRAVGTLISPKGHALPICREGSLQTNVERELNKRRGLFCGTELAGGEVHSENRGKEVIYPN